MESIRRDDGQILSVESYAEIMEKESHHDHELVIDSSGTIRWKACDTVNHILKGMSLNDICPLLCSLGYDKNSEVYRALYRKMGYSLSGYWEVFYWDWNNEEADQYKPQSIIERVSDEQAR